MPSKAHHMERMRHHEGEAKKHREMARKVEPKREMKREDKKEDMKKKRDHK